MDSKSLKRIAISGAGGQIAYNLLFRIASGEMLGLDQPLALHLLEVPEALGSLQGLVMELEDCAYPLLKEIRWGSDPYELFEGVNLALLVGAKPRTQNMERKDLLKDNGKIFFEQGAALDKVSASDLITLVVGNPCNTNCLIAMQRAPHRSPLRFFAMTRLDENRARSLLARKTRVPITSISSLTIWGNHSATQVPDFVNARIEGKPVEEVINDRRWLEGEFFSLVQKRGAAVIAARGKSSAASAAHAILQTVQQLVFPTSEGDWFSVGMTTENNPYGIKEGLIFSFPCRSKGWGKVEIIPGFSWDRFLESKILLTEKELLEEREMIVNFL
jgi:malate dehydrogenase